MLWVVVTLPSHLGIEKVDAGVLRSIHVAGAGKRDGAAGREPAEGAVEVVGGHDLKGLLDCRPGLSVKMLDDSFCVRYPLDACPVTALNPPRVARHEHVCRLVDAGE